MKRDLTAEYLGVEDAEAVTGISRWTWRRWAYDGRIESVKLGTRLLIPRRAIDNLVTSATRPKLESN
jgi:excisionase family DNA binding protein